MDDLQGRGRFRTIQRAVFAVGLLVGLAAAGLAAGDDEDPIALGTRLLAEERCEEALAAFDRAVGLDAQNADAHAGRCAARTPESTQHPQLQSQ